jgi:hypothetical protein
MTTTAGLLTAKNADIYRRITLYEFFKRFDYGNIMWLNSACWRRKRINIHAVTAIFCNIETAYGTAQKH